MFNNEKKGNADHNRHYHHTDDTNQCPTLLRIQLGFALPFEVSVAVTVSSATLVFMVGGISVAILAGFLEWVPPLMVMTSGGAL